MLQDVSDPVAALLPGPLSIRKMIQRERLQELPTNPTTIADLERIAEEFRVTTAGALFLIYDSVEDERYNLTCGRILIFSTTENLRRLMSCLTWYVDGTFKSAPSIFFQLFTILGSETQIHNGNEQTFALPYVYALLESKQEVSSKYSCLKFYCNWSKFYFSALIRKFSIFCTRKWKSLEFR